MTLTPRYMPIRYTRPMMTTAEVGELWNITAEVVRRWHRKGEPRLPAPIKDRKRLLFPTRLVLSLWRKYRAQ
jgi:hypothetical protein